jgi:hypothetical protein
MMVQVKPLTEKQRLTHKADLARMVKMLMQHKHDQAGFTRYGNYDIFHRFMLEEMRVPQIMTETLAIEEKTDRVPIIKVSALGCTRILLGKKHVSNVAEILADPHVAQQLELAKDQAIHPDTYRNLLEHAHFHRQARLETEKQHIARLLDGRYITLSGDGIYGSDTTFIEVPPQFDVPEVYNYRTGKKGKYLKVGFVVKLEAQAPYIIICVVVALGNVDDREILVQLLGDAEVILGPRTIKVLLIDRGFYDGADLYALKTERQIDFIIPPENVCHYVREAKAQPHDWQDVTKDSKNYCIAVVRDIEEVPGYPGKLNLVLNDRRPAKQRKTPLPSPKVADQPAEPTPRQLLEELSCKQLRAIVQQGKAEIRGHYQVRLARLKRLSKIEEVKAERVIRLQALNIAGIRKADLVTMILTHLADSRALKTALKMRQPARKKRAKIKPAEKQVHSYLTSLPVDEAVEIVITYHRRIHVDNSVIKRLQSDLTLPCWPSHDLEAVKNHVLMVCLVFNMLSLFRTKRGRSFTGKSITKLRSEFLGELAIAIYAGEEYVILTFTEFVKTVAHSVDAQFVKVRPPPRGSF